MLKAGTYYVGDLCYVMSREEWDQLHPMLFPTRDSSMVEGEHEINGKKIAIYGTAHGDGSYDDQHYNEYGVDSGSIGCILVSDADPDLLKEINDLGHIHEFKNNFYTSTDGSVLTFGSIEIDTDPRDDDEDFYNDEEDEEYIEDTDY